MDWFKGKFTGKNPYLMGKSIWFPVEIFPAKPCKTNPLNNTIAATPFLSHSEIEIWCVNDEARNAGMEAPALFGKSA